MPPISLDLHTSYRNWSRQGRFIWQARKDWPPKLIFLRSDGRRSLFQTNSGQRPLSRLPMGTECGLVFADGWPIYVVCTPSRGLWSMPQHYRVSYWAGIFVPLQRSRSGPRSKKRKCQRRGMARRWRQPELYLVVERHLLDLGWSVDSLET